MEWKESDPGKWRLVDGTGCIVGRVERAHDGDFLAFAGKHSAPAIGTYVTKKQAMAGVEGALRK